LRRHEHQLVDTAIAKMNLAQPSEHLYLLEACFFANLTLGGLLCGFALFDVSFRNCPTIFGVLNQQDFDLTVLATKYNTARGWFSYDFLDRWLIAIEILFEFIELWRRHSVPPPQAFGRLCRARH